MVESAENNTNQFWKTIGRVRIIVNRKTEIPVEILNDGGEGIRGSNSVFDKWKTDSSKLLIPTLDCTVDIESVNVMQNVERKKTFDGC